MVLIGWVTFDCVKGTCVGWVNAMLHKFGMEGTDGIVVFCIGLLPKPKAPEFVPDPVFCAGWLLPNPNPPNPVFCPVWLLPNPLFIVFDGTPKSPEGVY